MATVIDYADFSVHITSPQTAVIVQDLLNDIRTFEADVTGIVHPVIIEASGKESLGGGVQVGITMKLNDPWQLEFYAGSYRATIDGGNVVTDRADGNVIKLIANSPQIEILRSAAATIVATGSGVTAQDKLDIAAATRTNLTTELARIDAPISDVPTAAENAAAVRSNLTTELARIDAAISSISSGGSTAPTAAEVATAVWAKVIAGVLTASQALEVHQAILAGRVTGAGTGQEVFWNTDGTLDICTITVDASGNRTGISINVANLTT